MPAKKVSKAAKPHLLASPITPDVPCLTSPERAFALGNSLTQEFDVLAPTFYKEEDRTPPFLSLAIGAVVLEPGSNVSIGEIRAQGAVLRRRAKDQEKSSCHFGRLPEKS